MSNCVVYEVYNKEQIEEINKHKWIESEKAKRDLGQACIMDWIQKYAGKFRDSWCLTKCQHKDVCKIRQRKLNN